MNPRILLLGGTGYVGEAFAAELGRRGWRHHVLRRAEADHMRFGTLLVVPRSSRWDFLVHCAGFTSKPDVDACELARADTLLGNTLLPQTVAHACSAAGVAWGPVFSGRIHNGAKVVENGGLRVEPDMTAPSFRALLSLDRSAIHGFTEGDEPNFSFRRGPCSYLQRHQGPRGGGAPRNRRGPRLAATHPVRRGGQRPQFPEQGPVLSAGV